MCWKNHGLSVMLTVVTERKTMDHLFLAMALFALGIACLILRYAGSPGTAPAGCPAGVAVQMLLTSG
jgi:hypothetical protein